MTVEFPLVLAALPVLALGVAWLEFRLPGGPLWRGARLFVRLAILTLLLAALANVYERGERAQTQRLVVVRDAAARFSKDALAEAEAAAAAALSKATRLGIESTLLSFASDGPAAQLAAARLRFGPGETGGVLLISDGRGGLPGLAEAARALAADGLALNARAVPESIPPPAPKARILAFEAPAAVRGPFSVRTAIALESAKGAQLELRVDGRTQEKRSLAPGDPGELRFDDLDLPPGLHELSLTLTSAGDAPGSGPVLVRRLVEVGAPPRAVACLSSAAASPWRQALGAQGIQIADAPPEALADILTDAAVLPDLLVADAASLRALPPAALHILMDRIRQGLGLLLEAGSDREAWEALAERPLADLLPLRPVAEPKPPPAPPPAPTPEQPEPEIEPPKPDEGPGLKAERRPGQALPISLLLVIDCSPSMAGPKLQMALEGARRAALALSPWDRIGVISFANKARLDIRMRSARSSSSLELWLAGIEVRGEVTNIFASLKLASRVLAREKSPILHMILLTDGRQYPAGPLFGPVVKPMRRRGITITTVGIGRGARLDQLRDIVQWAAGGQVISAADASEIPTILTRDTTEIAEKRLAEAEKLEARLRDPNQESEPPEADEPPLPPRPTEQPPEQPEPTPAAEPEKAEQRLPLRRVRAHEALAGLEQVALPSVGAPRLSKPAYGAAVLLEREGERAVLAAGRAGLGRVLVWTLPPKDEGALAWPYLSRLFAQAGRAVMAPRGAFSFLPTARVVQGPDGATLHVDWPPGTSTGRLQVSWSAAGERRPLGVFTPEDGEAGRPLPAAPTGTLCQLEMALPEGPALPPLSYLVAPALEVPAAAGDAAALARALDSPLQPMDAFLATLPTGHEPQRIPRWPWALWIAALLLPLDVWLHRRGQAP